MDNLDQQLIALLRNNARTSVATLAHKLKVSRGTVTNRITRLENEGVIVGYTVQLRPDSQPNEIRAWMSIVVAGNENPLGHRQPAWRTGVSHRCTTPTVAGICWQNCAPRT